MKNELMKLGASALAIVGGITIIQATQKQNTILAIIGTGLLCTGILSEILIIILDHIERGFTYVVATKISNKFSKALNNAVEEGVKRSKKND